MFSSFRPIAIAHVLLLFLCWANAHAIDISVQYFWPPGTAPPGQPVHPNSIIAPFDPTTPFALPPVGLTGLMNYAANYYEDIFEDFHELRLNYYYEDLGGNFLGFNSIVDTDIPGDPARRVIEANVRIDTNVGTGGALRNWWIDPTPADDSEFDMQQTLWRDLSPTERSNWYNDFGSGVPDTFEVGYRGDAASGGPAVGAIDMLSTVLHEFGHSLGVPDLNPIAQNDSDYDFNPDFVFGETLAAESEPGDNGHLDNPHAMMDPSLGSGRRERPSHTDFFAMASGNDYFLLDVPRREYYGGSFWQTDGNWSGNQQPGGLDETYVRDGHSATLTANGSAASLFIQEDASVSTGANVLTVGALGGTTGKITVEGVNPFEQASLVVNAGGRVVATEVELNDGGILTVTNGDPEEVDVDVLDINAGGVLIGNGGVRINSELRNDGLISAIAGSSELLALLSGPVDLDGENEVGQVLATLGNLQVSANAVDAFDGQMTIGAGRQIQIFGSGWQIGQNGATDAEVLLDGGNSANPARLIKSVASLTWAHGTLNVQGRGELAGAMRFESGVEVNVAAGGVLETTGPVFYRGGTHQGDGELRWNGNVTVQEDTTIDVAMVNLDGDGSTQTTLDGAMLTLNSDQLDLLNNIFNGSLAMTGANAGLAVNLPLGSSWDMAGTTDVTGGSQANPVTINGSPIELSGATDVSGALAISAPVDISGSVNTALGTTLVRLQGIGNTIQNTAHIGGPGELHVAQGADLRAEDGATIVADLVNLGRLEPGFSTGIVTSGSDFLQTSTGTLGIELEGAPFSNQDQLQVTETAFLGGELEVTVLDGDMPTLGAPYTILTADSVSGTFDSLTVLSENPIFSYDADVTYTPVRVVVEFTDVSMFGDFDDDLALGCADVDALVAEIATGSVDLAFDLNGDDVINVLDLHEWLTVAGTHNVGGPYLPGDANLDGDVAADDFEIWNGNKFTSNPSWCSGDFTADGLINGHDFLMWNMYKFMSSDSQAVVPEPGIAQLALLVAMGLSRLARQD